MGDESSSADETTTWDELMGPSPEQLKSMLRMDAEPPAPVVRSSSRSRGAPPPSQAFNNSSSSMSSSGSTTTSMTMMPDRWAQLEPEADQVHEATRQAVATARATSSRRSSGNTAARLDADGETMDNSNNSHRAGGSVSSGRSGRSSSMQFEDEADDEDESELEQEEQEQDDSLRIRQEALRMLEVADDQLADSSYSVYRTKSGGFMASANASPMMRNNKNQKRVPTALAGIATRASSISTRATASLSSSSSSRRLKNSTSGRLVAAKQRYRDDPNNNASSGEETGSLSSSRSMSKEQLTREDYEYGDERVVDVVGMEKRFASSRAGREQERHRNSTKTNKFLRLKE